MIPKPEINFFNTFPSNDNITIIVDYGKEFGEVHVSLKCIYFWGDGRLRFLDCRVLVFDNIGCQIANGTASDVFGMSEAFENAMNDLAVNKNLAILNKACGENYDKCEEILWDASLMNLEKGIRRNSKRHVVFSLDAIGVNSND